MTIIMLWQSLLSNPTKVIRKALNFDVKGFSYKAWLIITVCLVGPQTKI